MTGPEKISVLGVDFDNLTLAEAVEAARALQRERRAAYVVTPNPEIVMICRENPRARAAVAGAALTIPDGIGVIYGAKLRGTPLKEKVPGIDFTLRLISRMAGEGGRVYLLGSRPGIAARAGERLASQFPGLRVAGAHDGYFQDDAPVIAQINAAAPDLLLVCLGAPKQEIWMHEHAKELSVGLMIGAGGSLDVLSGTVDRAPLFWRKAGLEWLYRLSREPRRIGRMMKLPKFLLCACVERSK